MAVGSEGAIFDHLAPKLRPYGRFERLENSISPGWPDVYYCLRGVSGWIELKYLPAYPRRPETPIVIPSLSREQAVWLAAEVKAGGRAYLLLQVGWDYLLYSGLQVSKLFLDEELPPATYQIEYTLGAFRRRINVAGLLKIIS